MTPLEKKLILTGISIGIAFFMIHWFDSQFKSSDWLGEREEDWFV